MMPLQFGPAVLNCLTFKIYGSSQETIEIRPIVFLSEADSLK